jgi:hypothetical protein
VPAPFEYGRFAFEFVEELDSLSNTEEVTNLITRFTAGFWLRAVYFLFQRSKSREAPGHDCSDQTESRHHRMAQGLQRRRVC